MFKNEGPAIELQSHGSPTGVESNSECLRCAIQMFFGINRCLPRMVRIFQFFMSRLSHSSQSWHPQNLYNLWRRSLGSKSSETTFRKDTRKTLFQQRWISKRLIRGYHGDYVTEKAFKRWFVPERLPDIREKKSRSAATDARELAWWRGDDRGADELGRSADAINADAAISPVGSLMLSELERRIDVIVFRACFTHSVYEAKRLVTHGYVYLNGQRVSLLLRFYFRHCLIFCSAQQRIHVSPPAT